MAKGVNKVMLLGNMGRAAEMKSTQGGLLIATFSLATPERVKRNDKWEDRTEWHNLIAFGRTAEIIRDYTDKGSKLFSERVFGLGIVSPHPYFRRPQFEAQ